VILQEPQRTPYDIQFGLFGFPVRVHPAFFVLPFIFGANIARNGFNAGVAILIFVIVFFLSILVHELGHSIIMKRFGINSRIVLYLMGGLAIPDSVWGGRRSVTPWQNVAISAAGPAAGFLLCGVFALLVIASGGKVEMATDVLIPVPVADLSESTFSENLAVQIFFQIGLYCNFFWSLLNLVPVFPLDGGQISAQLFQMRDYRNGMGKALMLGVATAGLISAYGFFLARDGFMGFFFAFMALQNYFMLQQLTGRGGGW
jgi:stage IV sporulation protein FB